MFHNTVHAQYFEGKDTEITRTEMQLKIDGNGKIDSNGTTEYQYSLN